MLSALPTPIRTFVILSTLLIATIAGCKSEKGSPLSNIIEVSLRYSMVIPDSGVLQLKNNGNQPITGINIEYHNLDKGGRKTYILRRVGPHETEEVGILESGWSVEENEVITISSDGFSPITIYTWKSSAGDLAYSKSYWQKKLGQSIDSIKHAIQ